MGGKYGFQESESDII